MKTAIKRSVAVSFGKRFANRIVSVRGRKQACHDRKAQHKQGIREQQAEDRRLGHDRLAGARARTRR